MADDVTKKDLQALEKSFNKQIADLKKQLDDQKKDFQAGLDDENKITVTARGDLEKKIQDLNKRFEARSSEIQDSINTLARAIGDVANQIKK